MRCNYIQLKTYGRTGSNVITEYFSNVGYHTMNSPERENIIDQLAAGRAIVVHDHSYDYIIPQIGIYSMCFFLKRRDAISQLLSMLVAKKFNFYHDVDLAINPTGTPQPVEIEKFVLNKDTCLDEARVFTEWHYKAAIALANSGAPYMTLYYEDYIGDIEKYFSFAHTRPGFKLMETAEKKNSLQAKNLIENYDEAVQWLTEWNISNGIY